MSKRLILLIALVIPAWAQIQGGGIGPTTPLCSASITTNCAVSADGLGNVKVGTNVPTVLGDGVSALSCPGKFASLNACLDAAKAFVTAAEDGTAKAIRIELPPATVSLTGPYALASGMQLVGVMPRIEYVAGNAPDYPQIPNGGTWIDCAAGPCFTGAHLRGVRLENLGFKNATNALTTGGDGIDGMSFSEIRNVWVIGLAAVNSTDIAFNLFNTQHVNIDGLFIFMANTGLRIVSQNGAWEPANSTVKDLFIQTYPKRAENSNNTKAGLIVQVLAPTTGTAKQLNFLTFIRPQVMDWDGDGTGTLVSVTGIAGAPVNAVRFYDMDLEGVQLNSFQADYLLHSRADVAGASPQATWTFRIGANAYLNTFSSTFDATVLDASGSSNQYYGTFANLPPRGVYYTESQGGQAIIAADVIMAAKINGPNLVTNGGFDVDANWVKQTGWTISGGTLKATSASYTNASQAMPFVSMVAGQKYRVRGTASACSGNWTFNLGPASPQHSGNGTFEDVLTYTAGDNNLYISSMTEALVCTFDNITVNQVIF